MDRQKPTLVIMAAGMGSRFGGLKQIEPVDPEGHIIIDFSLFDAWRAGFRDVVFIIKREMEAEFRECIGDRMEQYFHVSYVYQDLDRLPEGIEVPEGRTKPWGTGHALACCKGVVNGPFAVINADDFYGRTAFSEIYDFLAAQTDESKYAMVGYYTPNTFPFHCKINTGEVQYYWAEGTHPAIISDLEYQLAQKLLENKSNRIAKRHNKAYPLRQRVYCGSCDSVFRRKEVNATVYWVCLGHDRGQNCDICQVPEDTINAAFCRLYYKLKHNGNPIFTQMLSNLQKVRYSRMLWSEDVISLNKKISDILSQVQFLAQLQQAGGVDPDTFISSNNKLSEQLRRLKQEKARLLDTDSDDLADRTRDLMDVLEDGPDFLDSFDAELFDALVEKVIVDSNERLRFKLKNGLELTEQIERTKR